MKHMLIHKNNELTVIVGLEAGEVSRLQTVRPQGKQSVGNIYKGRVVNVLPGMQAAFVDIGQGKNAFLYIDELMAPAASERMVGRKPPITELVRAGDQLLVQIVKEPIDGKGARVSTQISLTGRSVVFMPRADYVGVSKKIGPEHERARLRAAGEELRQPGEGLILRTMAEHASYEELLQDVNALRRGWENISEVWQLAEAPALLYGGGTLAERIADELMEQEPDELWIDDLAGYEAATVILSQAAPELLPRLRLYEGDVNLLESRAVPEQLERAFARRSRLKSGGELVWDQTEALTVIDVNTGKFVGSHTLEDTVYQTNLEAAEAIARLLRLRDTGGIILIDFIDMELETHRSAVRQLLERELARDKTQSHVLGWTRLGLMELTRKKTREDAVSRLYDTCSACRGRGKQYVGLYGVHAGSRE
ncbi:Rne/Rng family ribonuclease [Paenibacillus daejeonensis]|uniref:Rne/Rng family ribonuclease n=1 Tax=Paenibacillus daejeonensis TaxID=135193 RepID=UPI0003732961|nr:Rne/Rng family ribonuclease [Paenibacillus daejeonensis]